MALFLFDRSVILVTDYCLRLSYCFIIVISAISIFINLIFVFINFVSLALIRAFEKNKSSYSTVDVLRWLGGADQL